MDTWINILTGEEGLGYTPPSRRSSGGLPISSMLASGWQTAGGGHDLGRNAAPEADHRTCSATQLGQDAVRLLDDRNAGHRRSSRSTTPPAWPSAKPCASIAPRRYARAITPVPTAWQAASGTRPGSCRSKIGLVPVGITGGANADQSPAIWSHSP